MGDALYICISDSLLFNYGDVVNVITTINGSYVVYKIDEPDTKLSLFSLISFIKYDKDTLEEKLLSIDNHINSLFDVIITLDVYKAIGLIKDSFIVFRAIKLNPLVNLKLGDIITDIKTESDFSISSLTVNDSLILSTISYYHLNRVTILSDIDVINSKLNLSQESIEILINRYNILNDLLNRLGAL